MICYNHNNNHNNEPSTKLEPAILFHWPCESIIPCLLPPSCTFSHAPPSHHPPPYPILAEPQPVQCFPLQCLFCGLPSGTLTLPPVPLPYTGEWSLITVHGFYDEMPLAHLASSCQLPLTSHYLCATQTRARLMPLILCGVDCEPAHKTHTSALLHGGHQHSCLHFYKGGLNPIYSPSAANCLCI